MKGWGLAGLREERGRGQQIWGGGITNLLTRQVGAWHVCCVFVCVRVCVCARACVRGACAVCTRWQVRLAFVKGVDKFEAKGTYGICISLASRLRVCERESERGSGVG